MINRCYNVTTEVAEHILCQKIERKVTTEKLIKSAFSILKSLMINVSQDL